MTTFTLKVQVFFVLVCLVIHSYGAYPSGSAKGRSFYPRGRYLGGRFGGRGQSMGRGGWGGASVAISLSCDEGTRYQDECQGSCYCTNNQLVCPDKNQCEQQTNPCPSSGSYKKDCNTCFCLDIGSVCTANQCS